MFLSKRVFIKKILLSRNIIYWFSGKSGSVEKILWFWYKTEAKNANRQIWLNNVKLAATYIWYFSRSKLSKSLTYKKTYWLDITSSLQVTILTMSNRSKSTKSLEWQLLLVRLLTSQSEVLIGLQLSKSVYHKSKFKAFSRTIFSSRSFNLLLMNSNTATFIFSKFTYKAKK